MFKSQKQAVLAAFAQITGNAYSGPVALESETRTKIGELLLTWNKEELWKVASPRCQGDELPRYIGINPASAMHCNLIDNFLTRDKKAEARPAALDPLAARIAALKELHAQGILNAEQLAAAVCKL